MWLVTDSKGQASQQGALGGTRTHIHSCTHTYALPASNMLKWRFPPTDRGIEGIQSANQLPISVGKGSSICPSF